MRTRHAQQRRQTATQRRRQRRVFQRITASTAVRPRLAVFRSLRHIAAQIIDDRTGTTLVAAHDRELKAPPKTPRKRAAAVGELLAAKAKAKQITAVVFDRRGYRYHGRVRAFADGARKGGLTF